MYIYSLSKSVIDLGSYYLGYSKLKEPVPIMSNGFYAAKRTVAATLACCIGGIYTREDFQNINEKDFWNLKLPTVLNSEEGDLVIIFNHDIPEFYYNTILDKLIEDSTVIIKNSYLLPDNIKKFKKELLYPSIAVIPYHNVEKFFIETLNLVTLPNENLTWFQKFESTKDFQVEKFTIPLYSQLITKLKEPISFMPNLSKENADLAVFGKYGVPKDTALDSSKYITYRCLEAEDQKDVRKVLYKTLYEFVKDKDATIEIPCITGFKGEKIYLKANGKNLLLEGKAQDKDGWELEIQSDGSSSYRIFSNRELIFTIDDVNHCTTSGNYQIKDDGGKKLLCDQGSKHKDLKPYLDQGPAFLELLTTKIPQVLIFLEKGTQGYTEQIFQSCLEIMKNRAPNQATGQKIVENNEKVEKISIGPMVNSVVASEDSQFSWIITKDCNKRSSSLELEKCASLRGSHQSSERKVIITQDWDQPDELQIMIKKNDSSDCHDQTNQSTYRMKKDEKGLTFYPIGQHKENTSFFFIRIDNISLNVEHSFSDTIQNVKQTREDIDFAIKAMTTVSDLCNSPHTMVLKRRGVSIFSDYYNLQDKPMPIEYIQRRLEFSQGTGNRPALAGYNFRYSNDTYNLLDYLLEESK